jgi:hypothetical protein
MTTSYWSPQHFQTRGIVIDHQYPRRSSQAITLANMLGILDEPAAQTMNAPPSVKIARSANRLTKAYAALLAARLRVLCIGTRLQALA